ncbi:conserved hypothetical protein [groundwater metagenome]|uniref:AAA+ ATPase domain-containing protein n=1 Tax=groundwater metagenome TaxID=717931 RepID=A0A098EAR3_9ZZZZ
MKTDNIQRIEFFNRETEKQEILHILRTEPQLINFIYGPINSGKTSLITNLIENLPDNYVVFYINLRKRPISTYHDFLEVIFDVKYEGILTKVKRFLGIQGDTFNDVISDLGKTQGIPIPKGIFSRIFKEERPENAFVYILNLIKDAKSKGKTPVLIIDELQTIGDLRVNEYLIYKVFNFFIHLTKESHLCHVFALSSDSLFIERVYNEAILKDRCGYLLIDNFDEETTKKFLKKYNFSGKEQENVYNNIGGKPAHLLVIIDAKNRGGDVITKTEAMLESRKKEIKDTMRKLKRFGSEITYNEVPYKVDYNDVISTLKMFGEKDKIFDDDIDEVTKMYLVKNNILFAECVNETIKPQSKLDLLAIREILKEN